MAFFPISLIDIAVEYDEVFIIDSFESDKAGEVRILNPSENYPVSTHYSGVPTLIRMGSSLGVKFHVIGIGVRNVSMGEEISNELRDKLNEIVLKVLETINSIITKKKEQ